MSLNSVTISGNLTRDAELRDAGSTSVCGFSVAVNDRRKNKSTGQWEDYPNFISCIMFGTRAEKLSPFLLKGLKVAVSGRLHQSVWEAKDGTKRSRVEVIVDEIELLSRKAADQQPQEYPQEPFRASQTPVQQQRGQVIANAANPSQMPSQTPQTDEPYTPSFYDEDIPF